MPVLLSFVSGQVLAAESVPLDGLEIGQATTQATACIAPG